VFHQYQSVFTRITTPTFTVRRQPPATVRSHVPCFHSIPTSACHVSSSPCRGLSMITRSELASGILRYYEQDVNRKCPGYTFTRLPISVFLNLVLWKFTGMEYHKQKFPYFQSEFQQNSNQPCYIFFWHLLYLNYTFTRRTLVPCHDFMMHDNRQFWLGHVNLAKLRC
jgi:hypothetical protein